MKSSHFDYAVLWLINTSRGGWTLLNMGSKTHFKWLSRSPLDGNYYINTSLLYSSDRFLCLVYSQDQQLQPCSSASLPKLQLKMWSFVQDSNGRMAVEPVIKLHVCQRTLSIWQGRYVCWFSEIRLESFRRMGGIRGTMRNLWDRFGRSKLKFNRRHRKICTLYLGD